MANLHTAQTYLQSIGPTKKNNNYATDVVRGGEYCIYSPQPSMTRAETPPPQARRPLVKASLKRKLAFLQANF